MNNYYILNVSTDSAINKSFDFNALLNEDYYKEFQVNGTGLWVFHVDDNPPFINATWFAQMKSIGLELEYANLFYRPPFQTEGPHIDSYKNNYYSFALNLVVGIDTSDMIWYSVPAGVYEEEHIHKVGRYTTYPKDKLVEINRHCIGNKLTLVRVDIPHLIELKDTARWCISFRTKQAAYTWGDTVKLMTPFINKVDL